MSKNKKQDDRSDDVYSYISPNFTSPSGPSTRLALQPTAPALDNSMDNTPDLMLLPSYEDAIAEPCALAPDVALPSAALDGFVRDESLPLPNPSQHPFMASRARAQQQQQQREQSSSYDNELHGAIALPMTANDEYLANDDDQNDQAPLLTEPQPADPFHGRPFPPSYCIYSASYEVKREGVHSRDTHLNTDPEALVQFFQQHNTQPRLQVKFYGYHEEHKYYENHKRQKKKWGTDHIVDFDFTIDASDGVAPSCQGIYVSNDPKSNIRQSLHELCEDYARADSMLKELRLSKQIEWNYAELTRALTAAIRQRGYQHSLRISFEMENYSITVKPDATFSKAIDNKFVHFFLLISCLYCLIWPFIVYDRKKFGTRGIKSQWTMAVSEQAWYEAHIEEVLAKVDPAPRTPLKALTKLVNSLFSGNH
ncbi:hypothetical protein BC940DRAFT_315199 [Gongronella butleri]|nr:hypothetical protein BC940DRAFT_315199 [Gongronella butleri]